MVEKLENKEEFSDKEKLKQVQNFINDMNEIWFWQWEKTIKEGDTTLKIESVWWDWSSFVKINMSKAGKEVFNYHMSADMFHKERWEKWPVWVTMKIEGKEMSYSWDDKNEHWVFDHHELLEKAAQYKKEIKSMLKSKEITENVSDFKNEFADLKAIVDTEILA